MADENTTGTENSETTAGQQGQDQGKTPETDSGSTETSPKTDGDTFLGTKTEDKDGDGADKTADGDDKKADEAKDENPLLGAPEGDYTLTGLPEGTVIDTEALAALAPVAKEIGLSDAGMSKLAGVYAEKILPHVAEQIGADIATQAAAQAKAWDGETRLAIEGDKANGTAPDPAFDGKDFAAVRKDAARALDRLGTPELRQFLETSGLGNNPALVRFAYNAGKAIKEEGFDRGGTSSSEPVTLQTALYGKKGE